jgi:hypothetical protein
MLQQKFSIWQIKNTKIVLSELFAFHLKILKNKTCSKIQDLFARAAGAICSIPQLVQ